MTTNCSVTWTPSFCWSLRAITSVLLLSSDHDSGSQFRAGNMLWTGLAQQLPVKHSLHLAFHRSKVWPHSSISSTLSRHHYGCGVVSCVHNSASAMRAPTGVCMPSLYDGENRQQQLGPRGVESFFVNKQGLKIATYFWPSEAPNHTKAVVLAIHGHGAHIQNEYLKRQVHPATNLEAAFVL